MTGRVYNRAGLLRMSSVTCGVVVDYRVSDEKDARGYLQALASKMTEELENLKVMGVSDDGVSIHSRVAVSL